MIPHAPKCGKYNSHGIQAEDTRICVVMVGLPARGKSLIAQKGNSQPHINPPYGNPC